MKCKRTITVQLCTLICLVVAVGMAAAAPSLQHAGGANGDDRNILACFAGVPGSGKTTLGAQVQANISNCTVISVDSAFNSVHTAPSAASSIDDKQPGGDAEEWHLAVRHVQQQCKQLLCEGSNKVIIIDDTLHLPSMRKVFFNLARQGKAACTQIGTRAWPGLTSIS